jgi:hypothetical protein
VYRGIREIVFAAALVTACAEPQAPAKDARGFDRSAVGAGYRKVRASIQSCRQPDGPTGPGHITVSFEPDGSVSSAVLDHDGARFKGTPTGDCIEGRYRSISVPPFDAGPPIRVGMSFKIE